MKVLEDHVDVGTLQLRFLRRKGPGQSVIMVHGLGASADTWLHQFRGLDPNLDCVAVDLPGFGRSDKPAHAPYGYTYFARAVGKLIDYLDVKAPVLMGHSLGGGSVLRLAAARPGMPKALVLIASGGLCHQFTMGLKILTVPGLGELLTRPNENNLRKRFGEFLRDDDPLYEQLLDTARENSADPATRHAFLQTLRNNATVFSGTRRSIRPILANLDGIQCPVLALWGEADPVIRLKDARPNLDRLRVQRLEVFPGTGHAPHFEHIDRCNQLISDFVRSLPA